MKMKVKYKICIGIALVLVIVAAFNINNVNAAINSNYSEPYGKDEVGLEESIKSSSALDLLGHLIYAIGRILEWLLGGIFEAISSKADFPWADRIVFNGVAILDANFINPDSNSFLGQSNISTIIKNTYATIFSLSLSFFGIFAMISAIKLAISTIAESKAKYKQALVDWTLGFVMLFCIHYFMSFMLYLNEQLVVVASDIAAEGLKNANKIIESRETNFETEFFEKMKSANVKQAYIDKIKKYPNLVRAWIEMGSKSGYNSKGIIQATTGGGNEYMNAATTLLWFIDGNCPSYASLKDSLKRAFIMEADTDPNLQANGIKKR